MIGKDYPKKCSDCKSFDYEEFWDGEEEHGFLICHAGQDDKIGWDTEPCEEFCKDEH